MRALSTAASVVRHSLGAVGEALLIAAILAALLLALAPVYGPARTLTGAGVADAARVSGHITVPDGVFGGTTTATVNPGGEKVWVHARCWQDGTLVYEQYVKVDANNQAVLNLGPTPMWTSGAADCDAREGYWARNNRWRTVASTTFHVAG
jgi:hypothetical protein